MSGINHHSNEIRNAFRRALTGWEATRETWNDVVAWNLETTYLQPMIRDVESLVSSLRRMDADLDLIEGELQALESSG